MDKQTAIKLAGGVEPLAELLGITRFAIYLWKTDVPKARVWQLRVLKPEWF